MANQTDLRVKISADLADIKQGLGLLRGELAKVKQQSAQALSGQGAAFADGIKRARAELKAFAASYLSLQGVRLLAGIADEATLLRGRLKEAKADYASVLQLAQRSRTSLASTVDLYASLERSTRGRIKDNQQLLGLTESINQAVKLSFTSQASGDAALFQLGQALSTGVLRGEELNSVMGQTSRLAQAIADGLGVPIRKLREMAKEGKLTADVVIKALQSQAGVLSDEYSRLPLTIKDAWTQLRNGVLDYVGDADAASGTSRSIAEGLSAVARNIGTVIDALVRVAALFVAHFVLFRAAPAIYAAATAALTAYKDQVIATALAQELGIKAATTWATRMRAAAGIALAAFTGWQLGSFLREQFVEVELGGIALASGLHAIAVRIRGYFEDAGLRIKLAMTEALNGVIGIAGRMNSAIVGVLSNLPGPLGAAYTKIGQASQRFINGLKLDTRSMAAEVSAANRRIAADVASVRATYASLADSAIARAAATEAPVVAAANASGAAAAHAAGSAKQIAESNALMRDSVSRALKDLERMYKDREIGIKQYFETRRQLQEQAIDLEIQQAQMELAVAKDAGQRRRLEEQIIILQRNRAEIGAAAAREEQAATDALTDKLGQVKMKLLELDGNTARATRIQLETEYLELFQWLEANSDATGQAMVRNLIDRLVNKATADEIASRMSTATSTLSSTESSISTQMNAGTLGYVEGERRLQEARQKTLDQLRELREKQLEYLRSLAPDSPDLDAAERGLDAIDANIANVTASMHTMRNGIMDQAVNSLTSFFSDLATGAKSFKDAFRDMVLGFIQGLAKMAAEMLAKRIIMSIFAKWFPLPSANGNAFDGGGTMAFARGGVFAAGLAGLTAFAAGGAFTNGVYDAPTMFAFGSGGQFGVMGEAGPEAVMPLERGPDGRLGVTASGGGGGLVTTPIVAIGDEAVANALASAAGERVVLTHVRNNWTGLTRG